MANPSPTNGSQTDTRRSSARLRAKPGDLDDARHGVVPAQRHQVRALTHVFHVTHEFAGDLGADLLGVLFGLIAMGVRWMVEGPQRKREREALVLGDATLASAQERSTSAEQ